MKTTLSVIIILFVASLAHGQTPFTATPTPQAKPSPDVSAQSDESANAKSDLMVVCPDANTLINGYENAASKLLPIPKSATTSSIDEDIEEVATSNGCQYIHFAQVASVAQWKSATATVINVTVIAADGIKMRGVTFDAMIPAPDAGETHAFPVQPQSDGIGYQIIQGKCDPSVSNVVEGPIDSTLTGQGLPFFCDMATVISFADHKGHVLVDFSQHGPQPIPLLGFGGTLDEDGVMMQVDNVYLSSSKGADVVEGVCKFFYQDQHISNIACGMRLDEGGHSTVAVVQFDAAPGSVTPIPMEYGSYTNPRFGFSIAYPKSFTAQRTPENGDGIEYTSKDGSATLKAYGGNTPPGSTTKSIYESALQDIAVQPAYSRLATSWFVLSWQREGKIYYQKVFVGPWPARAFEPSWMLV
jgi:hypothetical protein